MLILAQSRAVTRFLQFMMRHNGDVDDAAASEILRLYWHMFSD